MAVGFELSPPRAPSGTLHASPCSPTRFTGHPAGAMALDRTPCLAFRDHVRNQIPNPLSSGSGKFKPAPAGRRGPVRTLGARRPSQALDSPCLITAHETS